MKTCLILALCALALSLFLGIDRLAHQNSLIFSTGKITPALAYNSQWEIPPLSEKKCQEIEKILSQTYTYLGKGDQSYAFLSEDKRYVVKFFRKNKLYPKSWLAYIPLFSSLYRDYLKREEKKELLFQSCFLAYTQFQGETGLIYLHLNTNHQFEKTLKILDAQGKSHRVALDKTAYLIQKKAELIYPRITHLMMHSDFQGAKRAISSIFALFRYLTYKGVVDNDPILVKNFGLIGEKAIQIDTGTIVLSLDKKENKIVQHMQQFKYWIDQNFPQLSSHFEIELESSHHL